VRRCDANGWPGGPPTRPGGRRRDLRRRRRTGDHQARTDHQGGKTAWRRWLPWRAKQTESSRPTVFNRAPPGPAGDESPARRGFQPCRSTPKQRLSGEHLHRPPPARASSGLKSCRCGAVGAFPELPAPPDGKHRCRQRPEASSAKFLRPREGLHPAGSTCSGSKQPSTGRLFHQPVPGRGRCERVVQMQAQQVAPPWPHRRSRGKIGLDGVFDPARASWALHGGVETRNGSEQGAHVVGSALKALPPRSARSYHHRPEGRRGRRLHRLLQAAHHPPPPIQIASIDWCGVWRHGPFRPGTSTSSSPAAPVGCRCAPPRCCPPPAGNTLQPNRACTPFHGAIGQHPRRSVAFPSAG